MNKIVIASMRENAGKTSLIIGLVKNYEKKIGYMKPFGDRLLYRKKRLWDYDSAIVSNVLSLNQNIEGTTIGFEHTKLLYMFDEKSRKEKLLDVANWISNGKDLLVVEGGKDLCYGISVHLDALSVARDLNSDLIFVLSGNDDMIMDDLIFIKEYMDTNRFNLCGVIINKINDLEDFKETYKRRIEEVGIPILGMIPYKKELTFFTIRRLVEELFAKVLAGESALDNVVENIAVGAMSANEMLRLPKIRNKKKLLITSGDRSDVILAAFSNDTAGILLTNNILPPTNIIATAAELNIPLLLVSEDTYKIARQIDDLIPLLTETEEDKILLLEHLVKKYVMIDKLFSKKA